MFTKEGEDLIMQRRFPEAMAKFKSYLEYATACDNGIMRLSLMSRIGLIHQFVGNHETAYDLFGTVREHYPRLAENRFHLGCLLLGMGAFHQAWGEYEYRHGYDPLKKAPVTAERNTWDGSSLREKRLLIYTDQGYGDCIQFMRFLFDINKVMGELAVCCHKPGLEGFFKRTGLVKEHLVVNEGDKLPDHDYSVLLSSIPYTLDLGRRHIRVKSPYLTTNQDEVNTFSHLMEPGKFHIAVAWQGDKKFKYDKWRSFTPDVLAPLAAVSNVVLWSVQTDPGTEGPKTSKPFGFIDGLKFPIRDAAPFFGSSSFDHVGAFIQNMNLVICADTSIGHLAGALGAPTWLAVPNPPSWWWLDGNKDTIWYPHTRIFRQPTPGDWGSVFNEMADQLKGIYNG